MTQVPELAKWHFYELRTRTTYAAPILAWRKPQSLGTVHHQRLEFSGFSEYNYCLKWDTSVREQGQFEATGMISFQILFIFSKCNIITI